MYESSGGVDACRRHNAVEGVEVEKAAEDFARIIAHGHEEPKLPGDDLGDQAKGFEALDIEIREPASSIL